MPYRELYEEGPPTRARERAREALARLADLGARRSERADRPYAPPRRARRAVRLAFPVSEDAANPVNERPGMTNILLIHVDVRPFSGADFELVRYAVRSVHPLFETWYQPLTHGALISQLIIEVPGSKVARPGAWVHIVIERVLPVLHAYNPIYAVRFGRESLRAG